MWLLPDILDLSISDPNSPFFQENYKPPFRSPHAKEACRGEEYDTDSGKSDILLLQAQSTSSEPFCLYQYAAVLYCLQAYHKDTLSLVLV